MAHRIADRIKETASTSGTGSFTLAGAVSGFVTFASALTTNGDTTWYCAVNGAEWEVGLGTRTSSTVLARTAVLASSNSGSAVSFTAAPTVFSTVPGAKLSAAGGPAFSAYLNTSDQTVTTGVATKVAFNAEDFDTEACFDSTTNRRFTPNVAGYYQFNWSVLAVPTSGGLTQLISALYKNGTEVKRGAQNAQTSATIAAISGGGSALVYMNGTTDYAEVFGTVYGTTPHFLAGAQFCCFSGYLARPA